MSANDLADELWLANILPFVGAGHFVFVAGTDKKLKQLYTSYVSALENPPRVKLEVSPWDKRPATSSDTFYSAAFSSVSRAVFWDNDTKKYDDKHRGYFACREAAKAGNIPVLEWAYEVKSFGLRGSSAINLAAGNGHLEAVKYLFENKFSNLVCDRSTCISAAEGGQLEVLKYLHENGFEWDKRTCCQAAKTGHLEMLKYVKENGCPWDFQTSYYAAMKGHLEVLKYAHENGCPWNELTCQCAAISGCLEVLKYAHENGCSWDQETCTSAARFGHLEVLKYAHENGCPWDKETCFWAATNGHKEVLKWALENGCPAFRP